MRPSPNVGDSRATNMSRWRALGIRFLLPLGLFAVALVVAFLTAPAHAHDPMQKLAPDLEKALTANAQPKVELTEVQ